jgi:hypothetical protein
MERSFFKKRVQRDDDRAEGPKRYEEESRGQQQSRIHGRMVSV